VPTLPSKPVLIYDGTCPLCCASVLQLESFMAEDCVFLSSENAQERFNNIPSDELQNAVQFLRPDGTRVSGAEAILELLPPACAPLQSLYKKSPLFRATADSVYRFIADNRRALI